MVSVPSQVPLPVGIYARISSDREGDQLGVRRQVADCEQLAERRGFVVVERYVDDDVSAWSGRPRPGYERMLDDLRGGLIRGVLVWHIDRLTRGDLRVLESFIDLCDERGVELGCVTGDVDIGTTIGRLSARMLGSLARYESDHKSERIRRKHLELAQRGKVSGGGTRPYGYERDRKTIVPAEAAIVKDCAARLLAGDSLRAITADLNARGIPATLGGRWSEGSLRRVLKSARISGEREHHGELVATAEWRPIVTPEQGRQLRALLADPGRRTSRQPRSYLLTGVLTCGHCEQKLVARPRSGGQRRYACSKQAGGCGGIAIKADEVEEFIAEAVLYRLDSPAVAAAVEGRPREPESARWHEQLTADRAQLEQLATAHGEKQISFQEWLAARKPVEERIGHAQKQLAKATRANALDAYVGKGAELRREWSSLDLSKQHAIVAAVVDRVVVGPARRGYNRFDESRLSPVWRP
jgi:DNA invertase Pin-like site-specific DNA recombinase